MPTHDLAAVARRTRYPLSAFLFVQRALDFTVRRAHGEIDESIPDHLQPNRHVDARQLCYGVRDLAIQEYGLLARVVLRRWNIHRSEDLGRIVFAMVEGGLMRKTAEDSIEDFDNVLNFNDALAPAMVLQD